MFLANLNQKEKAVFWDVANAIVRVDGVIAEVEMEMLNQYQDEMHTAFAEGDAKIDKMELLASLKDSSQAVKKMIYFELFGLVYADAKYTKDEENLMKNVQMLFGITDEDARALEKCVVTIMNTYGELGEILAR